MNAARTKRATKARPRSASRSRTAAASADRHELYERSVQDPETDVITLTSFYEKYGGGDGAKVLREDFCGTGVLATQWAQSESFRRSVGIDLDQETMDWGRKRHLEPAGPDVERRVQLLRANVIDGEGPKGDIACALNFSYCALKTRAALRDYFKAARKRLNPGGLFVLDVLGGTDSMMPDYNETEHDDFTYHWEQGPFDPLTHELECFIHFSFPDGSRLDRAFSYDWRLWTAPELRDLLEETGFSKVHMLWERINRNGEWTGTFVEPKRVENQACWWTYIVAER